MRGAPRGRREELDQRLQELRRRIAAAATAAGRAPEEVALVVVTKFFPASDVRLLAQLGVADVGESRDQEAAAKAAECADLDLHWHFIGRLQSNKARSVAGYAGTVHSVDRLKLVAPLSRGALETGREVGAFVQVSLEEGPADGRGGAPEAEVPALADAVAQAAGLRLRGVMAVAPLGGDAARAFARLQEVAARVRRDHPGADGVSAGMSADLEEAVAHGATIVRVGGAVLGPRPAAR